MSRIQITLSGNFIFSTTLPVRVSDLNYGGHVGNDAILTLMQEARVLLYRKLGFKNEVSLAGSVGQIISDVAIQYKSESFLGDVLTIKIAVENFTKYGFDMLYLVTNNATDKEVARGKTGIVCFDYDKRKIAPIPESFQAKLQHP